MFPADDWDRAVRRVSSESRSALTRVGTSQCRHVVRTPPDIAGRGAPVPHAVLTATLPGRPGAAAFP
ncbi:hypothetical protein MTO96_052201 [Rhipicephalus appendiculatus]